MLHEQTSSLDDIGTVYRELISTLITRPFNREHSILSCSEEKNGELAKKQRNADGWENSTCTYGDRVVPSVDNGTEGRGREADL
ncbi:hypothetical protein M5E86_03645 [Blautia wexlerae]|nr:hypothetical protein M5E86_03645 [Blautia wexlerae]